MSHLRLSLVRNIVAASLLAILLFGAPLQLVAQERESPTADRASVIEWFTGLWSNLTSWLTGGVVPAPPEPPSESQGDNGCAVDPHGGCGS